MVRENYIIYLYIFQIETDWNRIYLSGDDEHLLKKRKKKFYKIMKRGQKKKKRHFIYQYDFR